MQVTAYCTISSSNYGHILELNLHSMCCIYTVCVEFTQFVSNLHSLCWIYTVCVVFTQFVLYLHSLCWIYTVCVVFTQFVLYLHSLCCIYTVCVVFTQFVRRTPGKDTLLILVYQLLYPSSQLPLFFLIFPFSSVIYFLFLYETRCLGLPNLLFLCVLLPTSILFPAR